MKNNYPTAVTLVEVGPRDGLQNESSAVSAAQKIHLIELLTHAGLKRIEAGSFVSPKWVPQMANSAQVFAGLPPSSAKYSALTPNVRGMEAALQAGVQEVAVFASASESFSQKNINCSIAESLVRFEPVLSLASDAGIPVRGYVSCVLGCPYEGEVAPQAVAEVSERLITMGCFEISLGDTIGVGTPVSTARMLSTVNQQIELAQLAVHFHDTYGQALANIHVALQYGISVIDTAVAGLGGCPYAKGASGNVATEDVLFMLNGMNIQTGVDMDALLAASSYICDIIQRPPHSKVARALSAS